MNNQKILIVVVFLLLTGATTGLILHAGASQKLGAAGVRTQPLPGTKNLKVIMPDKVPGYTADVVDQPATVINTLPPDTSYGRCLYTTADGFQTCANVVLMGTDRMSIHKPEICLTGQGWEIEDAATKVEIIHMQAPFAYDLPVMRLTATLHTQSADGHPTVLRGTYVYWYVDGDKLMAKNRELVWTIARDVLLTGVLDRFSYIAYFSVCAPGQEEQTFDQMKKAIMETVPKFQLVPRNNTHGGNG